jgi:DNA replication protein DnaC
MNPSGAWSAIEKTIEWVKTRASDPTWQAVQDKNEQANIEHERNRSQSDAFARLAAIARDLDGDSYDLLRRAISRNEPPEPTSATRYVAEWVRSSKRAILILGGGVGTGKSTAAAYWHLKHGGAWCHATELIERTKPWNHETNSYQPLPMGSEFMVLDDLGTERGLRSRVAEAVEQFAVKRNSKGMRTIITTNLPKSELRARYGERFADRLNQCATYVHTGDKSLRDNSGGFR